MNGTKIETQNGNESGSLKPVLYLPSRTRVTGSGTISDPYIIKTSDINIIVYTYNGAETDIPYETLRTTKIVDNIECEKGSNASWDYGTSSIKLSNTQMPEYCTVHFIDGYKVTLNVEGGEVIEGESSLGIKVGESTTFKTIGHSNQNVTSVSCDGGATITQNKGLVTVTNINSSQTCTIKYKVTFTINSASCPDTTNDNSGACYIVAHGVGTNYHEKDWNRTAKYGGKSYKECTIVSSTINCINMCSTICTDISNLMWYTSFQSWGYVNTINEDGDSWSSCSVTLICDQE